MSFESHNDLCSDKAYPNVRETQHEGSDTRHVHCTKTRTRGNRIIIEACHYLPRDLHVY